MFCSKCGNKLKDDFNFCNECGAKISVKEHEDQNIEKIIKHLEFLGYEVTSTSDDNKVAVLTKKSDPVMQFFPMTIGESCNWLAFSTAIETKIKEENSETNLMLKEANDILLLFKSFFSSKGASDKTNKNLLLKFFTIFAGEYNEEKFSQFIRGLESDLRRFVRDFKYFDSLLEK